MKLVRLRDGTFWDRCRCCGKTWDEVNHGTNGRCRNHTTQNTPFDPSIKPVQPEVALNAKQKALFLEDETREKFGYTLANLTFGSNKPIITKCDICGQPKETPYQLFLKEKNLAHFECCQVKKDKTNIDKYGTKCSAQAPEAKEKRKQTCLDRYGVEYAGQSKEIQEKKKQTMLLRYGVEYAGQSSVIKEKIKQTMLLKYGVESPSQSPEVQQKMKQTCLDKYGVENPQQASEVREKTRQTMLQEYGVEYPSQSPEIREKIRQANLKNLGVENPAQLPLIQRKIKETTLERYGVEHLNQLPENRERLKEWCIENPGKLFTTKPEQSILDWVQQYYPSAQKYRDGTYEIDIFIPEINVGIEYNGLYHHQESVLESRYGEGIGRNYHINKTKYFKEKGIRIIHIFGHEWKDRKEQVQSFLQSAIGKNTRKIGARQCKVVWTNKKKEIKEAYKFLEKYHIQGAVYGTKYAAMVWYEDELVSVATFGRHHRNKDYRDWVLTRFCAKKGVTIQGLLSKVTKLASREIKEDMISWADYRISIGNGYEKAGWEFDELLRPDYFYHKNRKVVSKQSRQKKKIGTPEGMTEKEHAQLEGWERVYDCGKIRYIYKYKE